MATDPATIPPSVNDAHGRVRHSTPEELREKAKALGRAMDEINRKAKDDPTGTDEVWAEVFRSIDEGRPDRKLFEGMY